MSTLRLSLIALVLAAANTAGATPFSFSYGGRLSDKNDKGIQGPVNLQLNFFTTASGGSPINVSLPQVFNGVNLDDGVYQVDLTLTPQDLDAVFPGSTADTFIEVVDQTHGVTYPRQRMSAIPYALKVPVDGKTISFDANGNLTALNSPLNVGTSAGQLVSVQTGGKLPVLDGSQLSNVTAASISGQGPLATLPASDSNHYLRGDGTWASLSATSPLAFNSGVFSLPVANATGGGYLAATDWSAFNGRVSSQWLTGGSTISYGGGNVGIGSPTPATTLAIKGSASPTKLSIQDNGGSNIGSIETNQSNMQFCWYNNTCPMTVTYTNPGKVGIDNPSPVNALDVNGGVSIGFTSPSLAPPNGLAVNGSIGIGVTAPMSVIDAQANWVPGFGGTVSITIGTNVVSGASTNFFADFSAGEPINVNGTVYTVASVTNNNSLTIATNATSSGSGLSYAKSQPLLQLKDGTGSLRMLVKAGGNVGIGTNSPHAKLHVGGVSGTDGIMFPDGTTQTTASIGFSNITVLTTGSSWTVPAGVSKMLVKMWGGGGGGGDGTGTCQGGGGGAGGYIEAIVSVTPGSSVTYAIGGGGTIGSSSAGSSGQATTFSVGSLSAGGGSGGPASNTCGATAAGGTNSGSAPISFAGMNSPPEATSGTPGGMGALNLGIGNGGFGGSGNGTAGKGGAIIMYY